VIKESGGPRKIIFGRLSPGGSGLDTRDSSILGGLHAAGIQAESTNDISSVLWKKLIFISSVGGLTALTRLTLGEILAVEQTRQLLRDALLEAESVARAAGATVEQDHVAGIFERLHQFSNDTRSSIYHDLTHDKPLEVDALSGTIVRYGQERGVPTPIHRMLYAALLPYHLQHLTPRQGTGPSLTRTDRTSAP
jgi:2-dehydropantoate 2-reductase